MTSPAQNRLHARHHPSGLNSHFAGAGLSFAEYVCQTQAMLRRVHAGKDDLEKIVAGNTPFESQPAPGHAPGRDKPFRRGVLLTHGLTDSPYFMRHLAAFFQRNGFRVMAVLLPGHGTQPGDLLDVSRREWAATLAWGVDCLAAEAEEVYLAGFSLGGVLSLLHSLDDERIRGLFLFSPALDVPARAWHAHWHRWYGWLLPSARWVHIKPDADIYKYESLSMRSVAEVCALIRELHARLRSREVAIPVFAAASADDVTVRIEATLDFMTRTRHPASRLVLYTARPDLPPRGFPARRLELVNSAVPEQNILGSSHMAILLPAHDPHYGAMGEYVNCVHYFNEDMTKYEACMTGSGRVSQGEISKANMEAGVLRRLMYNPHFEQLELSMQHYIATLPATVRSVEK
jgi:esterase/lipase